MDNFPRPNNTEPIRDVSIRTKDGIIRHEFIFTTVGGIRRAASLVKPQQEGPLPVILYVHWYEPASPDSNRTQFYEEALIMAKRGAMSLMVETLWSDRDWFIKRTQAEDADNSIQQITELRQAMDILLADRQADKTRFAYVGHDFGGMYGVLLGNVDPRPTHYVVMAATPRFHEWFLYYPKLEGKAREDYIEQMAYFDPISRVAKLAPCPILFQFAEDDFHVPIERAEEFYAAAQDPKEIMWYEAGHGLNEKATHDRIAWLTQHLGLPTTDMAGGSSD